MQVCDANYINCVKDFAASKLTAHLIIQLLISRLRVFPNIICVVFGLNNYIFEMM